MEKSSEDTVPSTTLKSNVPPEPDEDLKRLYEKINQQKDESDNSEKPTT
jgi:hypothetical protein